MSARGYRGPSVRQPWDRFFEKVDATGPCWEWTGAKQSGGYGVFQAPTPNGWRAVRAHRYVFQLLGIALDPDLTVDHLCRNPPCVNPDHLEQVTQGENNRRAHAGVSRRRELSPYCRSGRHPMDRTWRWPSGGFPQCKECKAERLGKVSA